MMLGLDPDLNHDLGLKYKNNPPTSLGEWRWDKIGCQRERKVKE